MLAEAVDLLLALFPFEAEFFAQRGIRTEFVGHPLADALPLTVDRDAARRALGLPSDRPIIAVMPGSRTQELARLLEPFVAAVRLLAVRRPSARFVLCTARAAHAEWAGRVCAGLPIDVVCGLSQQVLSAADVAIVASGTVTLEALLCRTPMVVGYRLAPLSYHIIRRMVRIPRIALPNILTGRDLVPELIQGALSAEALADAALAWLDDAERRRDFYAASQTLHATLRRDAAARAADAILELIDSAP